MGEPAIAALKRKLAPQDGGTEGVWPDNVPIVEAFDAAASQWRTAPIGGGMAPIKVFWLGLDYTAARVGIRLAGLKLDRDIWAGVLVMEATARRILNGVET